MKTFITGAGGFVGSALTRRLAADRRFTVDALVRSKRGNIPDRVDAVIGDLATSDWTSVLTGVDAVVHLAARVHVMQDRAADPIAEFRRVNLDGTIRLAHAAAAAGVRRFVYASSIKVHGDAGHFRETDAPRPADPYGTSKLEAEQALQALACAGRMEVVIVRPPLVYGAGVAGNFATLVSAIARGVPLPFGALTVNRRSLIGIDNLVHFIETCLLHPRAANETFLISDGEDLSTTELVRRIGRAMHRPVRLVPVPPLLLRGAASLLGKSAAAERVVGSLTADVRKAGDLLGWRAPVSVDEGLRRATVRGQQ